MFTIQNTLNFICLKIKITLSDNGKITIEKDESTEHEVNHNFEADMYLEKLNQENEKVNISPKGHFTCENVLHFLYEYVENREIGQ